MSLKNYLLHFCAWSVIAASALSAAACSDDETSDAPATLYYPEVVNIAPTVDFVMAQGPDFQGPVPTDYEIAGITCDGQAVQTDLFSINPETGAVSFRHAEEGEEIPLGTYLLSIGCKVNGNYHVYPDVLIVKMVAPLPAAVIATPSEVKVAYETVLNPEGELPTVELSVEEGASISVKSWAFPAEAVNNNPFYAYFKISKNGVISLNTSSKVLPGHFELDVQVNTSAGEKGIFEKVVSFDIQSKPLTLTYAENLLVEAGSALALPEPKYVGSLDGVNFSIAKVTPVGEAPQTSDFKIDAQTGCVSVEKGNTLQPDTEYDLDVLVKNDFGEQLFEKALHVTVTAVVAPIENFKYEPLSIARFLSFTVEKAAGFKGDNVSYEFKGLPAELEGLLSIDRLTGVITTTKQVEAPINLDRPSFEIPAGEYDVVVLAKNMKAPEGVEAVLKLSVVESKAYFTKFGYGNNLNLPTTEANQFRYVYSSAEGATETIALDASLGDIPSGQKVVFSVTQPDKFKQPFGSCSINETSGEVKLAMKGEDPNACGMVMVRATVGEGAETFYRTIPLFVASENKDNMLSFTPFVMKVNPVKGGRSVQAVSHKGDKLLFDYRRNATYQNLYASEKEFPSGKVGVNNNFLSQMWDKYALWKGGKVNYGAKAPLSYFENESTGLQNAWLYIDNNLGSQSERWTMVVTPNAWIGSEGNPASGVWCGGMTAVTNGNAASVNKGTQIWPIMVWFDERF